MWLVVAARGTATTQNTNQQLIQFHFNLLITVGQLWVVSRASCRQLNRRRHTMH